MSATRLFAPIFLAVMLPLAACNSAAPTAGDAAATTQAVTAMGATMRLNPNADAPSAAYFTLTGGAVDATLTGAASTDLDRAELHESRMVDGMMSMSPIERLLIPAGGEVVFRQGGRHVMLFGLSDAARAAGTFTLTLTFADHPPVDVMIALPDAPQATATTPSPAAADPMASAAPANTASQRTVPIAPLAVPPVDAPAPAPATATDAPSMNHDEHAGH